MGVIFAHDQKAYERWRKKAHRAPGTHRKGLIGQALESAIGQIAQMFPENVIRGTV